MTQTVWILLGVAGLAAAVYWPLAGRGPSVGRSVLKTLAVAALALAGLVLWAAGLIDSAGGPWLILGLALGAIGDFALSRPGAAAFRAGLGAFLAGHLAYVALFLVQPESDLSAPFLWPGIARACLLVLFCAGMAWPLWRAAGEMRAPVLVYVAVIGAMGLAALTLPVPHWGQVAALLFIASDAVLAAELFLLRAGHPARQVAPWVVWPLYWLAQALFLWTFAFQTAP